MADERPEVATNARVAAAEHLLGAYREMAVAGAHLGKVPGIPDQPLLREIQRVAADVVNVIGNLAPGLLEAIEADAAGGVIPTVAGDPEVRALLEEPRLDVGLSRDQRTVLAYVDGYLIERNPKVRARLHAAFPFLDALDDAEARRDG